MLCSDCKDRVKPFNYCKRFKIPVGNKGDLIFYGCNIDGEIPE